MKSLALILAILVVALASVLAYVLVKPEPAVLKANVASMLADIEGAGTGVTPADFPLTVTDDLDRSVSIEGIPQRIVSIAPSCTEILFTLGLEDRLVGVTNFCDYPEAAKQKEVVTSYYSGTDPEKIVSADPDLILTDGYALIYETLEGLGLTMVVLQPEDIAGILDNIALVGKITAKEAEAGQLIKEMKERVREIATKTAGAERPRVFYEIYATGASLTAPWTAGSDTFVDALIAFAGGENIVRASDFCQFSLEELVLVDPDIVILGDYPSVSPQDVMNRPGAWQQLTAVKEGKVFAISDPSLTSRAGPRIVDGLDEMAKIIHPELFE